jgi:outer membrane immunogenic protein
MKKLALALAGIAAFAGSAQAADMPVKARPAPVPAYGWTGFYVGFNAGYAGSNDRSTTFTPGDPYVQFITCDPTGTGTCAQPASSRLEGGFGGLQAGYNWQASPSLVAGLEADFQGSAINGTAVNPTFSLGGNPAQISSEHKTTWFGTVRGRLGFLPTDRLLVYGTGGFAFGQVEASSALTATNQQIAVGIGGFGFNCTTAAGTSPNCFTRNSASTATGWTAGAGFEFALTQNISVKGEYLYVNLGTDNHALRALSTANILPPPTPASFIVSREVDFNLVRVGLNYRFNAPVVAKY